VVDLSEAGRYSRRRCGAQVPDHQHPAVLRSLEVALSWTPLLLEPRLAPARQLGDLLEIYGGAWHVSTDETILPDSPDGLFEPADTLP
jgi:hypothetical protein